MPIWNKSPGFALMNNDDLSDKNKTKGEEERENLFAKHFLKSGHGNAVFKHPVILKARLFKQSERGYYLRKIINFGLRLLI